MKRTDVFVKYAVMLAIILSCGPGAFADAPAPEPSVVYVIPIRGMIEPALLYVIRRGVAEAEAEQADAIIFVMDTPGGRVDAAENILRTINGISVPTFTYVEKNAFSAGAIIALATDSIYMAPGSVIGDAMPIMMTPMGGVQEMSEGVEEKTVSAVSAMIRAAAEQGGHDPELAESMVRREKEYKIGKKIISKSGELLTLTNVEAEQLVGKLELPLLSSGTVKDFDELLEFIGLHNAVVKELQVTTAERIARFIAGLAPVFLIIGLLGVYIEVKTPGFGVPGIVGACSLAIFFWGHHIAGLAGMEDMVIFFIGFLLLVVEIFLIPGFGVIGAAGMAFMLWAVLSAMMQRYPGMPWYQPFSLAELPRALRSMSYVLLGTTAGAIVLGKFLPKWVPAVNRLVLEQSASREDGYTASSTHHDLIGLEGTAVTPLHPGGTGMFGEKRLDTITRGDFIDAGARIRIVETHGRRIIVAPCDDQQEKEG